MAPPAIEGAAFKKNCGSNAWTIIDGTPLDIKDHSGGHSRLIQRLSNQYAKS
jgi:hypothetical protein